MLKMLDTYFESYVIIFDADSKISKRTSPCQGTENIYVMCIHTDILKLFFVRIVP